MDNNKLKCNHTTNQLSNIEDVSKREFLKKCNTYSKPVITLLLVGSSSTTELNAAASNTDDGW